MEINNQYERSTTKNEKQFENPHSDVKMLYLDKDLKLFLISPVASKQSHHTVT